jgi:predicted RNase H-like nuclease (RuvC/YqgF family)
VGGQQAVDRFFASEGIERDYSGPIAEAEVWKSFLDEFPPEERAEAFDVIVTGYARVEHVNTHLEATLTRARGLMQGRGEKIAQLEEKIAQLEEKIARLEEENAQLRAEAERQGVRD